jgi:MFS superfamily sulfate permease-like transporter
MPPYFSGIIAGVVGGIVVGAISGSPLSVSGPAAGLTSIVASAIAEVPAFEAFLLSVVIAGFIQLFLGFVKAGVIGDFVPSSVIKGMLAAIGIILIMKQLPHLVGYDADFEGDESFVQPDGQNTISELLYAFRYISPAAMLIGFTAIGIQLAWDTKLFKANKVLRLTPAALVVVLVGVLINYAFAIWYPELALVEEHLVNIPISGSISSFVSLFTFPDIAFLSNYNVWLTGVTIAIVASLESLLSLEASDKLDPYKRVSPTNRELIAQGSGNIISGLIGGLPVTAVIVRSSANINAGALSKMSAILHGVLLLFLCLLYSRYS